MLPTSFRHSRFYDNCRIIIFFFIKNECKIISLICNNLNNIAKKQNFLENKFEYFELSKLFNINEKCNCSEIINLL